MSFVPLYGLVEQLPRSYGDSAAQFEPSASSAPPMTTATSAPVAVKASALIASARISLAFFASTSGG